MNYCSCGSHIPIHTVLVSFLLPTCPPINTMLLPTRTTAGAILAEGIHPVTSQQPFLLSKTISEVGSFTSLPPSVDRYVCRKTGADSRCRVVVNSCHPIEQQKLLEKHHFDHALLIDRPHCWL